MTRRRRVELYFAVAFLAASLSYADRMSPGRESDAGVDLAVRVVRNDPYMQIVFFLDEPAAAIGVDLARRLVNVATASAWGIGLGFLLALALIDDGDRWRFVPRPGGVGRDHSTD